MKKLIVLIAVFAVAVGASVILTPHIVAEGTGSGSGSGSGSGPGSGPGSGSGNGTDCSPGYWKTHYPIWDHVDGNCGDANPTKKAGGTCYDLEYNCCADAGCTADVLAALEGSDEGPKRAAQGFLNSCFDVFVGVPPCDDEDDDDGLI